MSSIKQMLKENLEKSYKTKSTRLEIEPLTEKIFAPNFNCSNENCLTGKS